MDQLRVEFGDWVAENWRKKKKSGAMFFAVEGFGIVMREGVTGGDSCSQLKDRVGQVDEPGPKGVTSCLGNVTAPREGEQIGERGGLKFLPTLSGMEVGEREPANYPDGCCVCSGLGDSTAVLCALHALPSLWQFVTAREREREETGLLP